VEAEHCGEWESSGVGQSELGGPVAERWRRPAAWGGGGALGGEVSRAEQRLGAGELGRSELSAEEAWRAGRGGLASCARGRRAAGRGAEQRCGGIDPRAGQL
jgi:hypothetical protein